MQATVTPLRPKDRTNAARQRRYRQRRAVTATVTSESVPTVTVDTTELVALAVRLEASTVTRADLDLASRLIAALVRMLPPNGTISIDP